jgi:hypothetical protein
VEIIANLRDRMGEARANGWTGEVEGLQTSLNAAGAKLAGLDRMNMRPQHAANHVAALGIPEIKPRERKLPERSSNSDPVQYLLSERSDSCGWSRLSWTAGRRNSLVNLVAFLRSSLQRSETLSPWVEIPSSVLMLCSRPAVQVAQAGSTVGRG